MAARQAFSPVSLFVIVIPSLVLGAVNPVCYQKSGGNVQVVASDHYACNNTQVGDSPYQLCCFNGDICGIDNICHYTHALEGGTGYYVGGCTDPSYKDPTCANSCTSYVFQDITYNANENLWHCCGDGAIHCPNPTNDTFQAAPLSQWSAVPSLQTSTATASATGSQTASTSTGTASSTASSISSSAPTSSPTSSGLSTGAKAGVGIGAAAGALAIIGLGALIFVRRKRLTKTESTHELMDADINERGPHEKVEPYHNAKPPMYTDQRVHEAPMNNVIVEAPTETDSNLYPAVTNATNEDPFEQSLQELDQPIVWVLDRAIKLTDEVLAIIEAARREQEERESTERAQDERRYQVLDHEFASEAFERLRAEGRQTDQLTNELVQLLEEEERRLSARPRVAVEPEAAPPFPSYLFRGLDTRPLDTATLDSLPGDLPGRDHCLICYEPYSDADPPVMIHAEDDGPHVIGETCIRLWMGNLMCQPGQGGFALSSAFNCPACRRSLTTPELREIVDFVQATQRLSR